MTGGNSFLYQLRGMVFSCALGSILTVRALIHCLVICSVMKNVVTPSLSVSMNRLPSLGMFVVMLSKCKWCFLT